MAQLTGHTGRVWAVGTANGHDRIVSAGDDGTVRIWDPETGLLVRDPLASHSGPVLGVSAFHSSVVSVGSDGKLVVQPFNAATHLRDHTALSSDEASSLDRVGPFGLVAQAVADLLLDPATQPPVTIGVKGPWGGGKSSMMLMIRDRIDPPINVGDRHERRPVTLADTEESRRLGWKRFVAKISRSRSHLSAGEAYSRGDDASDPIANPDGLDETAGQHVWRPSVWFNPWHYQSGEQVWAGLAMTLTDQVTARMKPLDRERFFLRLNLARLDRHAVRRRAHGLIWRRLALPLSVLAAVAMLVGVAWSVNVAVAGFPVAALLTAGAALLSAIRTPVKHVYPAIVESPVHQQLASASAELSQLPDLIRDPAHHTKVGYPYLAYVDVKRVIQLVATPDRPLVIFIDDLDRCTPSVVTQTIEALNLFLAGPFENCTFVMAVEPTVLAAHVASTYDALAARQEGTSAATSQQFGWRFLEKMVQLPVIVPRPTRQQAATYLTDLLPPVRSLPTPEPATTGATSVQSAARLTSTAEESIPGSDKQAAALSSHDGAVGGYEIEELEHELPPTSGMKSATSVAARERFVRSLASEPAFHEACKWAAENLLAELNPRRLKRLLAMIQLYALIANRLGFLSVSDSSRLAAELRDIGVLAALNIRWPDLVDQLLAPDSDDPDGPLVIERLQSPQNDSPVQLPGDLREFVKKHEDALSMVVRLTTLRPIEEHDAHDSS